MQLRSLNKDDNSLLFSWINQAHIRRMSFNSSNISLEQHNKWFDSIINSPNIFTYIASVNGKDIGQIRFEEKDKFDAIVSIYLEKGSTGKGLGEKLLTAGLKHFYTHLKYTRVFAYIKSENPASIKTFMNAGFIELPINEASSLLFIHQKLVV
jgi:RimJ/RimL family protein N-acetyltransferase